ncbi:hybrid sensor histidine kinase/response regulator [Verrucomicrobiaceae bacterium SCGC AG-212-N21]|nr:hybrid sensor histidine kinase/response regulator [Verrucomicrobiaceae bacterium SCGC AG-212-N21]
MNTARREIILIVDDQEENLRMVGNVLTMMSYEVTLAKSAEEAIQSLSQRTPDLILLDVMMPDTDGLAACRRIKSDPRWEAIPVIFLSAADDKNLIVQALETGGVDYVTKPFNMAELVSRVRTQLALKSANDQLRVLAEDKDEILGILTHDLKNSLAGMRLSAGLLQSRIAEMPPRCAPLVLNIVNATERMLAFVKEFLANQHAEHLTMKKQTVNVCDVVHGLATHHQSAADAKRIELVTRLPKSVLLVQADLEGLMQALENLVSNAIKFTSEGGKVEMTVEKKAGMVRCVVRDNGPGFTQEDRAKMFRRYGRLSAQPTGDEPSTGLGLSIVKRLIDGMGGSITLAEQKSPGAEFIVALPLANTKSSS